MFLNFFHYQGLVNLVVKRRGRPLSQIHGFGTDLWDIKRLSLRLKCVHSHFLHLSWDSSLSVCSLILILVQCLSPAHDDLCTSTFFFFLFFLQSLPYVLLSVHLLLSKVWNRFFYIKEPFCDCVKVRNLAIFWQTRPSILCSDIVRTWGVPRNTLKCCFNMDWKWNNQRFVPSAL